MTGLFWAVSLALNDMAFLVKWRPHLKWEELPKGPVQFIMAVALEHWDDHHQLLDWPTFIYYLDELVADGDAHEEYRQVYIDLASAYTITEASLPVAWEAAEKWIQEYHIGKALDRARAAITVGDRQAAFSELLGLHELVGIEQKEPLSLEDEALGDLLRQRPTQTDACPLGITRIDDWWEGGVYPGDFALVAADTNVGKSMMLCHLAAWAYRGNKRVLYFTYELTPTQVAERVLCALFQDKKQNLNPDMVVDRLVDFRHQEHITRGSLVIDNGEGIRTVAQLRARLAKENVDLVLLDSADDLQPRGKYEKGYESSGEIYTDIRMDICQSMGLPVWASVQMNREAVEKSRTSLRHIADAFVKAQRAHLVLGMSQTPDEREHFLGPFVKLVVLKDTQHGSRGKWERYRTRFGRGAEGWPGFEYWPEKGEL